MSSALVTCPECGRPMKRKNLWSHLRVVHRRKEEDVSEIRARLNKEAEAGSILCPLCNKCFPTHEVLALHCQENYSENGAAGRPQDYSRISRNFTSRDEYQTWEKKTKQLVESSLRPAVDSALYRLLKEVDLDKFQRRFADILVYLRTLNQTHMAEYLEKNYLGKTPSWASFTSRGAVLDTTMISERFHLRIKDEFLHRNSNSRIDGFVDLLIKAVEDLSENIEVKDRRRFADSAYRLRETHKRHKTAATFIFEKAVIWTCTKTFEVTFVGTCTCDPVKNTHCITCGVCAYAWNCTCMDNRAGISCPHRHAVKMLFPDDLPVETAVMASEEAMFCHPELDSEAPSTAEQERREARYNKLSSIKSVYAVVQASATSLAKTDTDEAMQQLEKILGYMELAAEVAQTSSSSALAVRPKLAGVGGKPQLTKVELYQNRCKCHHH
ncbi:hypothetical protein OSTOST_12392 [Ostertagia ostertagi]